MFRVMAIRDTVVGNERGRRLMPPTHSPLFAMYEEGRVTPQYCSKLKIELPRF